LANDLYIFDSILAEETFKDAGDKENHGPVSLFSQQGGKFGEMDHPLFIYYQRGYFGYR